MRRLELFDMIASPSYRSFRRNLPFWSLIDIVTAREPSVFRRSRRILHGRNLFTTTLVAPRERESHIAAHGGGGERR